MSHPRDYRGVWERRDDETDTKYERFRAFLAMPHRNITELARTIGITDSHLRGVAVKYQWQTRAAAYDRWAKAELDRSVVQGTALELNTGSRARQYVDDYEQTRAELLESRRKLLDKINKMLDFDVGTGSKTTRKHYRVKNPQTKKWESHVTTETVNDPRWTWGDVSRLVQAVDLIGRELLALPPDVVSLMPEFSYELARAGYDTAEFMRRTIDKLKAS